MPSLSILLKPASCACNLHCDYCFYADEAKSRTILDYGMMSRAVSHALIDRAAGAAQGMVAFLFQGGEPTLAAGLLPGLCLLRTGDNSLRPYGSVCTPDQRDLAG